MSIVGLRSVADFTVDGQRPKNWREGILALYPNGGATLTALTALMKERTVDDPEFNWFERELTNRRFQLAAGQNLNASDNQTTVTISTSASAYGSPRTDVRELKAGDLLYVEQTGEIVQVSFDPTSATSLTFDRGFAGTTKTSVTVASQNPNFVVIGSAYEEGSQAPTGVQYDPSKVYNYTQIFRQTLEFTRTAMKTRLRTGDQVVQAKKDALEMLSMDMERAFILGTRSEATKNGKPIRTTDGVIARINRDFSSNIVSAATTGTKMTDLEGYIEQAFRFGSDEKIGLVGNSALLAIQQIVRKNSTYFLQPMSKEYGMNIMRFTTPFGELVLKRHTLFNNNMGSGTVATNVFYGMANWLLIIDPKNIQYTMLKGSDIAYQSQLQANGLDGEKSGYLGECAMEVHHPKTHMLIKRLVSGIKDT